MKYSLRIEGSLDYDLVVRNSRLVEGFMRRIRGSRKIASATINGLGGSKSVAIKEKNVKPSDYHVNLLKLVARPVSVEELSSDPDFQADMDRIDALIAFMVGDTAMDLEIDSKMQIKDLQEYIVKLMMDKLSGVAKPIIELIAEGE